MTEDDWLTVKLPRKMVSEIDNFVLTDVAKQNGIFSRPDFLIRVYSSWFSSYNKKFSVFMNGTEKDNNTSNDSKGSSTLISPSPDFWEDNNGAVTAEIESIKKKREFTKKLFPGFSIAALEKDRIVVSDAINREFIDLGFSTKKSEFICEKDSKSNSCIHARYLYQHEDLPRIYNYFLQRNNAEKVKAVASKLCVGFGVLAGLAGSL